MQTCIKQRGIKHDKPTDTPRDCRSNPAALSRSSPPMTNLLHSVGLSLLTLALMRFLSHLVLLVKYPEDFPTWRRESNQIILTAALAAFLASL